MGLEMSPFSHPFSSLVSDRTSCLPIEITFYPLQGLGSFCDTEYSRYPAYISILCTAGGKDRIWRLKRPLVHFHQPKTYAEATSSICKWAR